MRPTLAAALLAAIALAPASLAGTVPGPFCFPIVPAAPVPMPLTIPAPYPTKVLGPCTPATSDLVSSATAACPPVPPVPGSVILAGEYCGKLYLPGQVVTVTASGFFGGLAVRDFRVAMGFDASPFDGHLDPSEVTCISPLTAPSPTPVASTQCAAPLGPGVYRLIAWIVCPINAPLPPTVAFGYFPNGIGTGP